MTFQVRPYAQQGWSDRDFELAIPQAMAARGWHRVPAKMSHPWAYLAKLLEGVDPADRPTVYEDAHAAAEREHDRLQRHGVLCEHGVPGGDVVSPLTGQRGCPLCRSAR